MTTMGDFCECLHKTATIRASRDEAYDGAEVMNQFIHKVASTPGIFGAAARGRNLAGKAGRYVADKGGVVPAVTRAASKAGDFAGDKAKFVGEVMHGTGSPKADAIGRAVNAGLPIPHMLPLQWAALSQRRKPTTGSTTAQRFEEQRTLPLAVFHTQLSTSFACTNWLQKGAPIL